MVREVKSIVATLFNPPEYDLSWHVSRAILNIPVLGCRRKCSANPSLSRDVKYLQAM